MIRTLVIGLDGATLDLIEPWAQAGHLPHLRRLMERGAYGELRSVMPVLSSAAWVSFMTGMNPGKHGIFDFVQRDLATYRRRLVRAGAELKTPSLWRLLSEAGKQVGVVNVPMTYPVEPVNGVFVSGLGTPDYRPFTHPESLTTELWQAGYRVNKRVEFKPDGEQPFLDEVYTITDLQAQAALKLAESRPWDFFMHVVRDPDEMSHFFWRFMDPTHPAYRLADAARFGNALLDYYRHVDGWVGRFVEVGGPHADVIVVSDHGSGPLYKDVLLNEWLRQAGFLQLKASAGSAISVKQALARLGFSRQVISRLLRASGLGRIERWIKDLLGERIQLLAESARPELSELVDWSRTSAYSFGYHGQIYLNLRGREVGGIVDPVEYEATCTQISQALRNLVDPADGQPVVSAIYQKAEIFAGPQLDWAPDLTVIMRDLGYITRQGYEFAQTPGDLFATPHTHESGSHREMGVVIVAGPSFHRRGHVPEVVSLMDVAPTILHLQDCPIPSTMDGVVLVDWLAPATRQKEIVYTTQTIGLPTTLQKEDLSAEDEALVMQQLRRLGYIE